MIAILAILFFTSIIISFFIGFGPEQDNSNYNTAIIPIKGTIVTESSGGLFSSQEASSTDVVALIEKAKKDPNVKAIIFEINSPGGSPVATDEISQEIKSLTKNNITTTAWIREEGASGAYWIASSTEHIVANKMSIVGSIGVIGSYIEWYGLMNRYNVTYNRLVSGEYKDTGVPYRPMTTQEESYIQAKLDKLHEFFIEQVASNRNMSVEKVRSLADGSIYLGVEAKDNGLIDSLGGEQEAIDYIGQKLNITVTTKEFSKQKSLIESFFSAINQNSFYMGKGISSGLVQEQGMKITT
jgi:protease-4